MTMSFTIVVVSFDTLGALIQSIIIEFLLSKLVPETSLQGTAEGSKLELEVYSGGRCSTGLRCHGDFTVKVHGRVIVAVKCNSCR